MPKYKEILIDLKITPEILLENLRNSVAKMREAAQEKTEETQDEQE